MIPTLNELARMMDLSAVRTNVDLAEIQRLAETAKQYQCACVFVMPCYMQELRALLEDSPKVGLGGVVGFPSGATATAIKAAETRQLLDDGADELDMVINVGMLQSKRYRYVEDDIKAVVQTAGDTPVKVILETHYLTHDQIRQASEICVQAGAAFVKTSTGWAQTGATFENIAIIRSAVSGNDHIQIKAAGGICDLSTVVGMIQYGVTRFGVSLNSGIKILQQRAAMDIQV